MSPADGRFAEQRVSAVDGRPLPIRRAGLADGASARCYQSCRPLLSTTASYTLRSTGGDVCRLARNSRVRAGLAYWRLHTHRIARRDRAGEIGSRGVTH